MAQSSFHALKGPLARALGNLAKGGHGDALVPLWTEAVGPVLAARSRPVRLEAGVLTVEADRDFTFDLRRAEPELRQRLQAQLGASALRRIDFITIAGAA